uniref:NADH:ubiquinone reductase (H(+)-translocating) n=1 Tax=Chordodes sp. VVA-2019 TaxID=2586751 RepID=A0A514ABV8_9BILA|nr:NADH dehydrogenase subunit 5 [Chordodes sp. VVA-2019]
MFMFIKTNKYFYDFSIKIMMSLFCLYLFILSFEHLLLNLKSQNFWLFKLSINMSMNQLNSCFSFTLIIIIMNIYLFSLYYMNHNNSMYYYPMMMIFSISMFLMMMAPDLIFMILGWDMLGISSFFLIMFYQNYISMNKAYLTLLMNRFGDVLLLICISEEMGVGAAIAASSQPLHGSCSSSYIMMMGVGAAIVKSAQLPWSGWLLAAMAAPTPISSLVHSSTLVCAGVILLMYLSELEKSWEWELLLLLVVSLFMAAVAAMKEYDLKKIIALSTMNQMSFLMISTMISLNLTLGYMMAHAFFKSSMFISAGFKFHSNKDSQDIRTLGSNNNFLNVQLITMSSLSLTSFFYSTGFFFKEKILMNLNNSSNMLNIIIYLMINMSLLLTFTYVFKFINSIFFIEKNTINKFKNVSMFLNLLMVLSLLSFIISHIIVNYTDSYNFLYKSNKSNMYLLMFFFLMSLIYLISSSALSSSSGKLNLLSNLIPNLMGFSFFLMSLIYLI